MNREGGLDGSGHPLSACREGDEGGVRKICDLKKVLLVYV